MSEQAAELLFVGRLLAHKGVDLLIDAVGLLKQEVPPSVLVVGDGPEKLNLRRRVNEKALNDVIRFRSDVKDHDEVFALMKAAKVFVFPSLREGFGIAPLEALACGTRVVTTSHPDNQARRFSRPVGTRLRGRAQCCGPCRVHRKSPGRRVAG